MRSTKRFLTMLMVMALLLSYLSPAAAAAAPDPAAPSDITDVAMSVWAGSSDEAWLSERTEAFAAAHPEWNITWNLGVCNAGDAASVILGNPDDAADVFLFTSDQISTLTGSGLLAPITGDMAAQVAATHAATAVKSLRDTDGSLCGVPMSGNTWFMYYNKNTYSETDVKSLETMLEKGTVSFQVNNSWFVPAFYFAAGCTMFGENGNDAAARIQFGGEQGVAATRYLIDLVNHPNFLLDSDASGNTGLKNGTVDAYFSGTWDYDGLYDALGEDLGAAQLPTIELDGTTGQLKAFATSTAFGVSRNTDNLEAAQALAVFLGSAESQALRYEANGSVPTAASLSGSAAISANVAAPPRLTPWPTPRSSSPASRR